MATSTSSQEVTELERLSEPDPHVGSLLGQFRIGERLGQGGMGTVYRGVQLSIDRPVAVKLITGEAAHDPDFTARFRREAQAMAKLRHPNTVRLLDFGVTEQARMFMVMELLRGDDLETRLALKGPLELAVALRIVRQVAQSLSEAHALGIVHRDLKPGNIFLSQVEGGDSFVKVMDFGVAGFRHDGENTAITMQGAVLGTAAYMSPEQAQGYEVDGRADLYSLGVILFEMLTGRPPFQANTAISLLILHVSETPPRILEICPDAPELARVQNLLDTLLAKSPEERPTSAADVIVAVDSLLADLGAAISGTCLVTEGRVRKASPKAWFGAVLSLSVIAAGAALAWEGLHGFDSFGPQTRAQIAQAQQLGRNYAAEALAWGGNAIDGAWHKAPSSVTIASVPSGATVQLGGAELGKTPYQLQLKERTVIELAYPGHATQTVTVEPKGDPNLVVNLSPLPPYRSAWLPATH